MPETAAPVSATGSPGRPREEGAAAPIPDGCETAACVAPSISVVIPTFQRRDVVVRSVTALADLAYGGEVEVIVVVDGSTDGTADALRALTLPVPLRVVEQENRGAAAARNAGARLARGEILLFLDDDMEADPRLLAEHARSHAGGASAVIGHIPLHPDSPPNLLSREVGRWAERRRGRLAAPGAKLALSDLLTGQLSVRRELFEQLGGFDRSFTAGGSFGNEDLDFGCRLLGSGASVAFNADAVSLQRYVVCPAANLRQWRQGGEAAVFFARKHPALAAELFAAHRFDGAPAKLLWRPVASAPVLSRFAGAAASKAALAATARWPGSRASARAFFAARDLEYWRGVHARGGVPRRRSVLVLAYHAIADLGGDRLLGPYAVPPGEFEAQLDTLLRRGFCFVSAEEALGSLRDGRGLPRRPVLLTFDDCYEDLLRVAAPLLRARRIPALAFAVSRHVGGTNAWDRAKGARPLPLLGVDGLRELAQQGVEIGAHSMTHRDLTTVRGPALEEELAGAALELEDLGLPRPRFVAYPYGRHDAEVRRAAAAAGFRLGFSLDRGRAGRRADPFALPRTEIRRGQTGWPLLLRLARAPGGA